MEDLERFTRRSRLEGVSCGQKSYKSEQIEQINIDEKRFGEFGKIWRIYSPDDSSTRLGEADCRRVCLSAQKSYKSGQIEQINIDEKRFGRFGKICEISRRSRLEKSVLTIVIRTPH